MLCGMGGQAAMPENTENPGISRVLSIFIASFLGLMGTEQEQLGRASCPGGADMPLAFLYR